MSEIPILRVNGFGLKNGLHRFGNRTNDCGFRISPVAAFGIAIAICTFYPFPCSEPVVHVPSNSTVAAIVVLTTALTMRRRRRAQQANLAYIRNMQAQRGEHHAAPAPNYQAGYAPNYTLHQNYPTTPDMYPPPPGPPPVRDQKGDSTPAYDPTNAPQYPPPTYNV